MNNLPQKLKQEKNIDKFKKQVREWVKVNIEIKPRTRFAVFNNRTQQNEHNINPTQGRNLINGGNRITRYFQPTNQHN